MARNPGNPDRLHRRAAVGSALLPGLGHAVRGEFRRAATIFLTGLALVAGALAVGRTAGTGAILFLFMLIVLPWWAMQSYAAALPPPTGPATLGRTLRIVWAHAHDIRYLGALFLLTALTDFYIILAHPEYALTIFCAKPTGPFGILAKAQSPTLHVLIGYGFLRLARWSLFLYLAYAAFGLLNATANFACFGYGRVRVAFLTSLVAFTAYVVWRRHCFKPAGPT